MEEIDEAQWRRRLEQRQRQIDLGKNTIEYHLYMRHVPKSARGPGDPRTPRIDEVDRSKRSFDGLVRQWRRRLHAWYDQWKEQNPEEDYYLPKQYADRCMCKERLVSLCSACAAPLCGSIGCRDLHTKLCNKGK